MENFELQNFGHPFPLRSEGYEKGPGRQRESILSERDAFAQGINQKPKKECRGHSPSFLKDASTREGKIEGRKKNSVGHVSKTPNFLRAGGGGWVKERNKLLK